MANVSIYCKYPMGIIFNVRNKTAAGAVTEDVTIYGYNNARLVVAGYGVTEVEESVAEALFKQWAEHPGIKNGLIYKSKTADEGEGMAEERKSMKSGMDQLDSQKPEIPGATDVKEDEDPSKQSKKSR